MDLWDRTSAVMGHGKEIHALSPMHLKSHPASPAHVVSPKVCPIKPTAWNVRLMRLDGYAFHSNRDTGSRNSSRSVAGNILPGGNAAVGNHAGGRRGCGSWTRVLHAGVLHDTGSIRIGANGRRRPDEIEPRRPD